MRGRRGGLSIEDEVALETPEGTTPAYVEVQTPRFRRAFTLIEPGAGYDEEGCGA